VCHAEGRADFRNGKSRPLHYTTKPRQQCEAFLCLFEWLFLQIITQVIIRHLGREVRTIRDLFITCLSIR
ncbi:hypothetical protein, partial [Photobacterium kishitanii]|uniref:hypothetical protein n=1 Tax=Photobacterium kishitanii TaxID=318456 RepID=UPI001F28FF76